jgi:tryptophan synthase alpha chain
MSLAQVLQRRRAQGRCAFVPFIEAGDPSLAKTALFLDILVKEGADIVELGVPFSDPVADGPAIQEASQRALKGKVSLFDVINFVERLRRSGVRTPIILFTYLNPVLRLGYEAFAARCARAGVDAALVVDLPVEEAGPLTAQLRKKGVEPVLLASPTTSDERLRAIGRASGSIVYYVSREGVTGVRAGLAPGVSARIARVRRLTGKSLIVGFGVATGAQARALAPAADGIVVGSALVLAASGARPDAKLKQLARELVSGL